MAGFLQSNLMVIKYRPWRWTTPPTYNPDGSVLTAGVKQELQGVFILLSDALVDHLAATLTQTQKDELRSWIHRVTNAQAAEWHVPMWAGDTNGAVFIRVPAATWNDPSTAPPTKVRTYFQKLYQA
jgi:hypothetical protein